MELLHFKPYEKKLALGHKKEVIIRSLKGAAAEKVRFLGDEADVGEISSLGESSFAVLMKNFTNWNKGI